MARYNYTNLQHNGGRGLDGLNVIIYTVYWKFIFNWSTLSNEIWVCVILLQGKTNLIKKKFNYVATFKKRVGNHEYNRC